MKNKALIYLDNIGKDEKLVETEKRQCLDYAAMKGFDVNPETDIYFGGYCMDEVMETLGNIDRRLKANKDLRNLIVFDHSSITEGVLNFLIWDFTKLPNLQLHSVTKSYLTIEDVWPLLCSMLSESPKINHEIDKYENLTGPITN